MGVRFCLRTNARGAKLRVLLVVNPKLALSGHRLIHSRPPVAIGEGDIDFVPGRQLIYRSYQLVMLADGGETARQGLQRTQGVQRSALQ